MKLRLKDMIAIAVVMVVTFPILYFVVLLATGNARIEFDRRSAKGGKTHQELKIMKSSVFRDSLSAAHSHLFRAAQREAEELDRKKEMLARQQERMNLLGQDLDRSRQELASEREKFEQLVSKQDDLEQKRIKQLARVYGAMRANEAARILETLNDDLLIKIINAIGDDRQKAKIVASISQAKASSISKKMGKPVM